MPRSRVRIFRNEHTRSTPLDHKLMFWCILWCLSSFGIVSLPLETWCKLGWSGAISKKSSCHEVVLEFFATNAPGPPHWTQNSCFGAFHSVWVHFGSFHYHTKHGANRAELVQLVQKFVPWSCDGIFRNERTHSNPLDPKLMFLCVSKCLGAFVIIS